MNSRGIECRAVMRNLVVGAAQRPLEALQLQRLQLVAACGLDRLEIAGCGFFHRHARLLRCKLGNDLSLDAMRLSSKQRNGLATLVPDLDVVDAGAAAQGSFLTYGRKNVVLARRRDEVDAAARRDRRHVGAVAGKRKGA